MLMNTLLGTGVAIVFPLVGDVFMAVYKPNSRNALLLEKTLRNKSGKVRVKDPDKEIDDKSRAKRPKERAWWKGLLKSQRPNNSNEVPVAD